MEDIIVPLGFFTAVVLIVAFGIKAKMKRVQMEHEERMLAIERGVALPQMPEKKVANPYKWPVILIALGLAMTYAMLVQGDNDWAWGLLPLFIGVGLLYSHRHLMQERKRSEKRSISDSLAPATTEKQPSAE